TTEPSRSSRAHFSRAGLELMDTAIAAGARSRLFPDGRSTRILVLAPPPEQVPHMIMAHGMAQLIREYELPGSRLLAGARGADFVAWWSELYGCQWAGLPWSLIGSSLGFVHFFDCLYFFFSSRRRHTRLCSDAGIWQQIAAASGHRNDSGVRGLLCLLADVR